MITWTSDELNKIEKADELQIASLRDDGTLRKRVTIWVVRVGDDIYVRSAYERNAAWFRGTQLRHEGRIWAGGVEKDVTFIDIPESASDLHDRLDAAYRAKYRRYPQRYVSPVISAESRSVTLMLVPRTASS